MSANSDVGLYMIFLATRTVGAGAVGGLFIAEKGLLNINFESRAAMGDLEAKFCLPC